MSKTLSITSLLASSAFCKPELHEFAFKQPHLHFRLMRNPTISTSMFALLYESFKKQSRPSDFLLSFIRSQKEAKNWSFDKFMALLALESDTSVLLSAVPDWFLSVQQASVLFSFVKTPNKDLCSEDPEAILRAIVPALVSNAALPVEFWREALPFSSIPYLVDLFAFKGVDDKVLLDFMSTKEFKMADFMLREVSIHVLAASSPVFIDTALSLNLHNCFNAVASSLALNSKQAWKLFRLQEQFFLSTDTFFSKGFLFMRLLANPLVSISIKKNIIDLLKKPEYSFVKDTTARFGSSRIYEAPLVANTLQQLCSHPEFNRYSRMVQAFAVANFCSSRESFSKKEKSVLYASQRVLEDTISMLSSKQFASGEESFKADCFMKSVLHDAASLLGSSKHNLAKCAKNPSLNQRSFPFNVPVEDRLDQQSADTQVVYLLQEFDVDEDSWLFIFSLLDSSSLPLVDFCAMVKALLL